ncbi:MAG: hypothetical protein GVY19_02345 [Bacteroidetes bacterium]|jgi:hypothetical protein|nr:hypothetical protein [Bacteroidota bacterium]
MSKKFKNFTEVLVAKERYKYKLKTKEEELLIGVDEFRYGILDSARNSVFKMGTKALTGLVINLIRKRYRNRKSKSAS